MTSDVCDRSVLEDLPAWKFQEEPGGLSCTIWTPHPHQVTILGWLKAFRFSLLVSARQQRSVMFEARWCFTVYNSLTISPTSTGFDVRCWTAIRSQAIWQATHILKRRYILKRKVHHRVYPLSTKNLLVSSLVASQWKLPMLSPDRTTVRYVKLICSDFRWSTEQPFKTFPKLNLKFFSVFAINLRNKRLNRRLWDQNVLTKNSRGSSQKLLSVPFRLWRVLKMKNF